MTWFQDSFYLLTPINDIVPVIAVQSLSRVQLFATPWTAACQAPLSFSISQSLLRFMSIESGMSDALQPSHSLSPPSPPALNLSQHQGLFPWVSSSHQVAKVLELSFRINPSNEGWLPLGLIGLISLHFKGFWRVFSSTVQKHQCFSAQPSLWSNSHICM